MAFDAYRLDVFGISFDCLAGKFNSDVCPLDSLQLPLTVASHIHWPYHQTATKFEQVRKIKVELVIFNN